MDATHTCPICGATDLPEMPRYPGYVCQSCAARARSADGRPLLYANEGMGGGLVASYAETGEPYPGGGRCWIDGIACVADEARLGGIVIEVAEPGGGVVQ